MAINRKYSFLKGITKALISFILFAIPIFITNMPDIANLTVGGILVLAYNYLKVKYLI